MNRIDLWSGICKGLAIVAVTMAGSTATLAQAKPTAVEQAQLSVFGGVGGVYTDFANGKNLSLTGGVDYTTGGFVGLRPALELRGTFPVDSGHIDSQKDLLIGPRLATRVGRVRPYIDFLAGRGEMKYIAPYIVDGLQYLRSNSTVFSPGVGAAIDLNDHWAIRADAQFQRWRIPAEQIAYLVIPVVTNQTPPPITYYVITTTPEHIWATAATVGLTYTFDFNNHRRKLRPERPQPVSLAAPLPPPQPADTTLRAPTGQAPPAQPANQTPPPPGSQPAPDQSTPAQPVPAKPTPDDPPQPTVPSPPNPAPPAPGPS